MTPLIPLLAGALLLLAGCVLQIAWNSCEVTDPDEKRAAALRMYSNAED